ncbi:MAG: type II toxin-antitoxin system VapC family toxin [Beijerinckiaceae bacterium]
MYLLDTNVISELRNTKRADPMVLAWSESVIPDRTFLSVMSILEIELGILLLARKDRSRAEQLRHWLERKVIPEFGERILPISIAVARRGAALHAPVTRPERDALIAATALEHRYVVVTRDVKDFAPMNVPTLNPWEFNPGAPP